MIINYTISNYFLKNYLKNKFFHIDNDFDLIILIPICTEPSSILTIDQFLFFCLSNAHIYSKKYAFKLFDCVRNGYNIPNLIYSFLGFDGPVVLFVQHYDMDEKKEYALGAYLNSNFKECYEKFCGDELSFIFHIVT